MVNLPSLWLGYFAVTRMQVLLNQQYFSLYVPYLMHTHTHTRIRLSAAISLGTFTLPEVLERCVLFSMSQAWQLGRAVLGARVTHSSVLDTIVSQQHGTLVLAGKVSPSLFSFTCMCTYFSLRDI